MGSNLHCSRTGKQRIERRCIAALCMAHTLSPSATHSLYTYLKLETNALESVAADVPVARGDDRSDALPCEEGLTEVFAKL